MKLSRLCQVNRIFSPVYLESRSKYAILAYRRIFTSKTISLQKDDHERKFYSESTKKSWLSRFSIVQLLKSDHWNRAFDDVRKTEAGKTEFLENIAGLICVAILVSALGTAFICNYLRKVHNAMLNLKIPPIPWYKFSREYLEKNKVKSIVYYPKYCVGEVFLRDSSDKVKPELSSSGKQSKLLHAITSFLFLQSAHQEDQLPHIRFKFLGTRNELEEALMDFHRLARSQTEPGIYFVVDVFPNTRELRAILIASGLASLAAALLVCLFM